MHTVDYGMINTAPGVAHEAAHVATDNPAFECPLKAGATRKVLRG